MIGICTDSNGQIPRELIDRFQIEVVPLTITADGRDYLEGVDLDADGFYDLFEGGRQPTIATAAPSPGRFADAYAALAERGATSILSVHIGSELSGTLNAARVGAAQVSTPVRLVDTHAASFIVGCATWEAADALARGASIDDAAVIAEAVATACGNVFIVGTLTLAVAGGRMATSDAPPPSVPVLQLADGKMNTLGDAGTAAEAAAIMAEAVVNGGDGLRVGIGDSDTTSRPVADELERRLASASNVREVVRYRVGPSVGAHTGPGTAGVVFYAAR